MNKEQYIDHILKHKNVKRQSAVAGCRCLCRVLRHCDLPEIIPSNPEWVTEEILFQLETLPNTPQKNLSSALLVYLRICGGSSKQIEITGQMLQKCAGIQENAYLSQDLSEKQYKNWVSFEQVCDFYRETYNIVKAKRLFQQKTLSYADRLWIQKLLMIAIHGALNPPPRCEFSSLIFFTSKKTALCHPGNSLYFAPKGFVNINVGKSTRGILQLPKKMSSLFKKMSKFLTNNSPVFIDKNGQMLKCNAYGKRLKNFYLDKFGKKIGVSLLRVIYISQKYAGLPTLENMKNTSKSMMHNLNTALLYYKKNIPVCKNAT